MINTMELKIAKEYNHSMFKIPLFLLQMVFYRIFNFIFIENKSSMSVLSFYHKFFFIFIFFYYSLLNWES